MIAEVYYDGYWTALDGEGREVNPYQPGAPEEHDQWRSWEEGWEDAQLEGLVSER
jgi:hypothetical protein